MERTAAQARAEYEAAMGAEVGAIFAELWQELVRLHRLWEEFVVLFGTSEGRIDLLNEAAGTFFGMVENTFWDAVLLGIARMTDPSDSPGKPARRPNLSIRRLATVVTDKALQVSLAAKVQVALDRSEFCRDWRNRRIAHSDLDLAVGRSAVSLPAASRADVNAALEALADVLNEASRHLVDSETHFRDSVIHGAEELLFVLRGGVKSEADRRERIASRNFTHQDLHPPPLP